MLPKFMICFNEQRLPGVEYVLHTEKPRFVARLAIEPKLAFVVDMAIDPMSSAEEETIIQELETWYDGYLEYEEEMCNQE